MKIRRYIPMFLAVLWMVLSLAAVVSAQETVPGSDPEIVLLGKGEFEFDRSLPDREPVWFNSASNDLTLTLKDVHYTDGLMSFTLSYETSENVSGYAGSSNAFFLNGQVKAGVSGTGIEPGPFVRTETYAWYNTPAVYGMDWKSFRITFEDVFFTLEDGGQTVYVAPAEYCSWSFVFHNPETDPYNADGYAPTVDAHGTHTFGDTFEINPGGFVYSRGIYGSRDDVFSFNIITKSDLLNNYGSQDSMWYDGEWQRGGGGSIEFDGNGDPVLPEDGKFRQNDHFTYLVPHNFAASAKDLAVWAKSVSFEISCAGESVDPDMGYKWIWEGDLLDREGKSLFPMKLVQFSHVTERLPQPDDPALFSQTVNGVTVDIVGLDIVTIPRSGFSVDGMDTGTDIFLQADYCFTAADDGEWNPVPGDASVGDTAIWASTYGNGGMIPATADSQGKMCGRMRYNITDLGPDLNRPLTLSISDLFASPREGSPCKDILHRFGTSSAAQDLGVALSCKDEAPDGPVHSPKEYTLTVDSFDTEKWAGEEEALAAAERALDYRISGPWVFQIENIADALRL